MKQVIRGAQVYINNHLSKADVLMHDGLIADISPVVDCSDAQVLDFNNCVIFPGLIDVHVHLREPGFSFKETIAGGTAAAAAGGYTTVCSMPNLKPAPDSPATLQEQLDIIQKDAVVKVVPYGTITVQRAGKELADLDGMAEKVAGFSDDGSGIQTAELMHKAMLKAKSLGKIIAAHCEDMALVRGGCIHDGEFAKAHGLPGICSESEWGQIKRDLVLADITKCKYHVCHISTKESVEVIRKAKAEGVDVTCETAPHYLVFNDGDLLDEGRFKMNPPIREEADRLALLEGIKDGTIDMIATDHAPHTEEEKSRGLKNSAMGIVGLETAFPVLYTELVKKGVITLEKLIELMHTNPSNRFGLGSPLAVGNPADLCVYDLDEEYEIDPATFKGAGRATPFAGRRVFGRCKLTIVNGKTVHSI